ncbi:hypothetical protein RvY_06281 [Ramazzottius varieornatus]|uniref:TAP-C domain-containing protein n=1 Tax=Ramazzottius varieornatus TaxID=947166 RepID=A0A1D1V0Z5_RAMVA|nr:hypothetical protein RvY_06281 [Ramazzottius varieornatus]
MDTNDKEDLLIRFQNLFSKATNKFAWELFLDMSNWNLQQAVCSYYDLEANQENILQMPSTRDDTSGEDGTVPPMTNS